MSQFPNHECTLSKEDILCKIINTGVFTNLRRKFRRYLMINRKHPLTNVYYNSNYRIQREEYRHLVRHYHMIHPFSLFSLYWTYLMTLIFLTFLIIIPLHIGLPISKYGDTRWILLICQIIHIIFIVLCFRTGYHDRNINLVVFDQRTIAKKYLFTYFFPEFISILPVLLTNVSWSSTEVIVKTETFLLFLKLVRIPTMLGYSKLIRNVFHIPSYISAIFNMVMAFFCVILWTFALLWHVRFSKWSESYFDFLSQLEKITQLVLLIDAKRIISRYIAILAICFGFIFQLLMYVYISHIWHKYNSVALKETSFYREVDAYMRYRALPVRKRKRIKIFFDYKFQGSFYKEPALHRILPDRLRKEVMLAIAHSTIRRLDIFKNLPDNILRRIGKYLTSAIYLPGDVIIQAGTEGDAMYFIVNGTVGVTTPEGKQICVLKDGANFGEISILLDILRVATVIAITPSEILRLNKSNFLRAFRGCRSKLELLKKEASNRLAETSTYKKKEIENSTLKESSSSANYEKELRRKVYTMSEETLLHEKGLDKPVIKTLLNKDEDEEVSVGTQGSYIR